MILVQTQKFALPETILCRPCLVAEDYLIVALRFFVATSRIYDPLIKSTIPAESINSETKLSLETDSDKLFKAAREAVKQER